jgi:DNA-directed RNA polymerase III subunit RPC2
VIGIVSQTKTNAGKPVHRCISKFLPWNASFSVAKVEGFPPGPSQSYRVVKITLHRSHKIDIGNKFSCGHGQKGTCGRIISKVDAPTYMFGPMAGTSPVLYLSVFAMNRCTMGFLIEILLGTAVALSPAEIDQYATIFQEECDFQTKLASACHILKKHGLNHTGRNQMFDGTTGKMMQCFVFSGFAYFRVLKHIAELKLRSRGVGPEDSLVRQPCQGQWQNGGLRFGELDYWNSHSHGTAATSQNFNYDAADKFIVYFCRRCRVNAMGCFATKYSFCQVCKTNDQVVRLRVPYVSPLTQQEMFAAGWGLTYILDDKVDPGVIICDEQQLINPILA